MVEDKTFCVYKHTSPSGKCYIGVSCNPKRRWDSGWGYRKNFHFWRAIQKYGWKNFKHEILYEGLTPEEAADLERQLIKEYKSTDRKYGYNLRDGGDGALSLETRQKISESHKGKPTNRKCHMSDETKRKISESRKEYYQTHRNVFYGIERYDIRGENNPNSKKVCMIDESNNILATFGSINEAVRETGLNKLAIIKCCQGIYPTYNGYIWRYCDNEGVPYFDPTQLNKLLESNKKPRNYRPNKIPIAELDTDGRIIETFESLTQASTKYGLDISYIAKCCRGKCKSVKGHIFKYLSEVDQPIQADFLIA